MSEDKWIIPRSIQYYRQKKQKTDSNFIITCPRDPTRVMTGVIPYILTNFFFITTSDIERNYYHSLSYTKCADILWSDCALILALYFGNIMEIQKPRMKSCVVK